MVPLWLALVVFGAFGIEAALGFGCNVLAVTVGVYLLPLDVLLVVLVSLNLLVSAWIVLRHRDTVDLRLLLTEILPSMFVGTLVGMVFFHFASGSFLKGVFGVFVVVLGGLELGRLSFRIRAMSPLGPWRAKAILLLGGVMHGLFASGGPMAVYYASRQIPDKRRFRGTLSFLWLLLNLVLFVSYVARGLVTWRTLRLVAPQVVPLIAGIVGGELLHHRVDERAFRLLASSLLAAGGLVLVVSVLG